MAAPPFPGLRFYQPTDDEIIRNYLVPKILGTPKPYDTITTEDVYSTSPEHLPLEENVDHFNDNEWYFYTTRTNKNHYLTRNGYYLTTSMDEQIFRNNKVVGFKRILRFYLGSRPETGIKTEWSVHEFQANPGVFPAANLLGNVVQEKLSSLVVCKILRTQEPSVNESEERGRDEGDSSGVDMEELPSTSKNLKGTKLPQEE
ncbi:PREDICTED: NAC domain-containing protein 67-like [Fragaria vesca subsp. vesca]|uniref:NAC domain-containing protein 67-like n=1 Tax=Fragaria vesca subsp. vesca TaxID=101020 RepID=UPI0002C375E3|nr:PREDICTED: NAC domain-containing protein 67-like [Fragaria vesca subsp. vesca]